RRSLAMHEVAAGRLVRLFDIDGPSPWQYYFICTPQLMQTARVKAFRDWVFDEVGRFRLLFEKACTENAMRSATDGADTRELNTLHAQLPAARAEPCHVPPTRRDLQHHLAHRMPGQRPINVVQMLAIQRAHRHRQAGVVAAARRPHFDTLRVEFAVELADHLDDRRLEIRVRLAHHLDGEMARKIYQ